MAQDDEEARKHQAAKWRARIEQLKSSEPDDKESEVPDQRSLESESQGEDSETGPSPGESPREFVHRRMRELNKNKGQG